MQQPSPKGRNKRGGLTSPPLAAPTGSPYLRFNNSKNEPSNTKSSFRTQYPDGSHYSPKRQLHKKTHHVNDEEEVNKKTKQIPEAEQTNKFWFHHHQASKKKTKASDS